MLFNLSVPVHRTDFALFLGLLVVGLLPARLLSGQSVTTQRYDTARTGQNLNETILTPSNVNTGTFGRLFTVPVDGYVYAQPLYLPNVVIPGAGQHNVVFIATEHDSVYAFDADSNAGVNASPLWHATLLDASHGAPPGATTEPTTNVVTTDITPEIGITGTPVIDPNSGTIYLVGETLEGGAAVQRLHALDITTGAEKFGGPVTLQGSVSGNGSGSAGGMVPFDPHWQNNRAGLLLLNNIVYLAFGSHGDKSVWHGWLLAYNATTLVQTGAFCSTPNGDGAGLWMAGSGLAADVIDQVNAPFGRLFASSGNGTFTAAPPYTAAMNYGDSHIRFDLANGVPVPVDTFAPTNQATLYADDEDLGSGGILLLPVQTAGGHAHLMIQAGKQGTIYLVDRDKLGGYNTTADNVVQEITGQVGGLWSTPAYWNGNVYMWGSSNNLKAFSFINGLLSTTPTSTSSEFSNFPGSSPVVSAAGTSNGIVWNIQSDGYKLSNPAILQAHDATNVATTLYTSSQNLARDNPGAAVKFTVPTVINGKVYIGAQNQFSVYGLLNGEREAAVPVINPGTESFSGSVQITMSDTTPGSSIFYTLDGSAPTEASTLYTGPVTLSTTTTLRAFASAAGYLQSTTVSQTYTLLAPGFALSASPATLTIPPGGSGSTTVTVTPQNGFSSAVNLAVTGLPSGATASFNPASTSSTSSLSISAAPSTASGKYTLTITGTSGTLTQTAGLTLNVGAPQALQFVPMIPCRVADTRTPTGAFGGPALGGANTRNFALASSSCNVPATALAFSLNVTVVPTKTLQYVTVWPQGQPQPGVSTLNSLDGRVKANAAIVPAGTNGGVSVYATDPTHVILDINGYFIPAGGPTAAYSFYNLAPCRVVDTRTAAGGLGGPYMTAGSTRVFPVLSSSCAIPASAVAYSFNYTVIPHKTLNYLTTWPSGQTMPVISTLNAPKGNTLANAAIVPAGTNGQVSVYVTDDTDLLIDVNGYFGPPGTGGLSLYTQAPCRVLDTRSSSGALTGTLTVPVESSSCAPNSAAQAYVFNTTVVPQSALSYLTLWADGQTRPVASTLNALDTSVTSNMAIVPTTDGKIAAYSSSSTQLILDLSGYFAP